MESSFIVFRVRVRACVGETESVAAVLCASQELYSILDGDGGVYVCTRQCTRYTIA